MHLVTEHFNIDVNQKSSFLRNKFADVVKGVRGIQWTLNLQSHGVHISPDPSQIKCLVRCAIDEEEFIFYSDRHQYRFSLHCVSIFLVYV